MALAVHKQLMLVEWVDSRQPTNEWVRLDGVRREFCRCYSVGFVVQDDEDVIALAANVADVEEEEQATGVIVIPRVAVLKRTVISCGSGPVSKRKRRRT